MHRTAFVSSMALIVVCFADLTFAQGEFKSSQGNPPKEPTHTEGSSTGGKSKVTTGVLIGASAPDFELLRLDGTPLRLSTQRGRWVMVWFVEHRDSLAAVEPVAKSLAASGVRTLAVCYDKSQTLARRLRGLELSYVPLADPTGEIVALYGLLDLERDTAKPGFVLVDPRGAVKIALLGHQLPGIDAARLVQMSVVGE
jgi:peroxiredoxin